MDLSESSFSIFVWHIKLWQFLGIYRVNFKNKAYKYIHMCICLILYLTYLLYYPFAIYSTFMTTEKSLSDILECMTIGDVAYGTFLKIMIIKV